MNEIPPWGEEFVRLALAFEEHMPGYLDAYLGPEEWKQEAKQAGQLPLDELGDRVDRLAEDIDHQLEEDEQRKDFLTAQVRAMQMSVRLLKGEEVPLIEEVQAIYDVTPVWKDESIFVAAYERLDEVLPKDGTLRERLERWNAALKLPLEKLKELIPVVTGPLRDRARQTFDLPDDESFEIEFVSDEPWLAYNWYQGESRSRIDINTDMPTQINGLPILMAHEGYPGHHTERCIKDARLLRQKGHFEQAAVPINAPCCVVSEAIATTALDTILPEAELADWYREELLPRAGLSHIDPRVMLEISRAEREIESIAGNAAFMLHDQKKSHEEIIAYMQQYGLNTEEDAQHLIKFISDPLGRSYIFTYYTGRDLLEELFARGDRIAYFRRLLEEPVTPGQIRQWIQAETGATAL